MRGVKCAALLALCTGALLTFGVLGVAAQEPYYRGKRLTLLINFASGGPTDIEGRLFAKHLAKHIPGQPTVIVQNIEGASGMLGAQFVGEVAPKDGTVLGYLAGVSWLYAIDPGKWRTSFKDFEFIAHHPSTSVHFVRTDVAPGIRTPADIAKAQGLVAGGLSVATSKDLRMRLGLDMLDVPHKYVTGYRSSAPARIALQRGEINMFSESPPSYRSLVVPSLVDTGLVIPVWWDDIHEGDNPAPQKLTEGLSVPTFPQLHRQIKGAKPSGPLWEAYKTIFEITSVLTRVIALPPGAPHAANEALKEAIERLNNDKDFAEEAMKVFQFVPEYPTAPDMSNRIRAMLYASPEMRKFFNDYMRNVPKR